MIVWRKGGNYNAKRYEIMISPGATHPDSTEFFDASGRPIQFTIVFTYGKTEDLSSNLAQYLLDNGLAQETRIILA